MNLHNGNNAKDGRITTPVINAILRSPWEYDEELERMYCSYCLKLRYAPLNYQRKYWSL